MPLGDESNPNSTERPPSPVEFPSADASASFASGIVATDGGHKQY